MSDTYTRAHGNDDIGLVSRLALVSRSAALTDRFEFPSVVKQCWSRANAHMVQKVRVKDVDVQQSRTFASHVLTEDRTGSCLDQFAVVEVDICVFRGGHLVDQFGLVFL